jgi:hypothetical protein
MKTERNGLAGLFFTETDEAEENIFRRGRIVASAADGVFLVQWRYASPDVVFSGAQSLVRIDEMTNWRFFEDQQFWEQWAQDINDHIASRRPRLVGSEQD